MSEGVFRLDPIGLRGSLFDNMASHFHYSSKCERVGYDLRGLTMLNWWEHDFFGNVSLRHLNVILTGQCALLCFGIKNITRLIY